MNAERAHEEKLIRRIVTGDRKAFVELVRIHQRMVECLVARLLDDSRDREEVCQDVFVRVHRGLSGFRGDAPLGAWISRIAHHTAVNRIKRRHLPLAQSRRGRSGEVLDPLSSVPDPTPSALAAVQASELREVVQRGIRSLPPVQRTVLTLFHLQEMPVGEIAQALEMPAGTVKSHLFRARRKLKVLLLEHHSAEELQP